MGYRSPLVLYTSEIMEKFADEIDARMMEFLRQTKIELDKDDLVKGLIKYSEGQYEKGYNDAQTKYTRHGKWEFNGFFQLNECSRCHRMFAYTYRHCPHCGAKMDEVVEK